MLLGVQSLPLNVEEGRGANRKEFTSFPFPNVNASARNYEL